MVPKILTSTELRKDLALNLATAKLQPVAVKTKDGTRIIIDENEYIRLNALANQFMIEDPEGDYRPEFVREILKISKTPEFTDAKSLSDLD